MVVRLQAAVSVPLPLGHEQVIVVGFVLVSRVGLVSSSVLGQSVVPGSSARWLLVGWLFLLLLVLSGICVPLRLSALVSFVSPPGGADSKVDSGKVLCFFQCGDFGVVGAPPVAWAGCLVGAVLSYSHPCKREG